MENNKKLTRASAGNRMVAGVCAGIADYFGWDPTLLRIVYVLATIFTASFFCKTRIEMTNAGRLAVFSLKSTDVYF